MPECRPPPAGTSAFDALRERGAQRLDPVRFRLAEALARRAGAHAGAARRVLDDKLAALLQTIAVPAASQQAAAGVVAPGPRRGALGELADHAARQKSAPALGPTTPSHEATPDSAGADAGTLQFFKRTWSRLSADQRLAQSRASLPDNAGPLNSHHLVHRSLTLMRELSPQYLERFVGYIDALQWLEQANEAASQDAGVAARTASGGKKSMAARRG
jgi:Tfp pilus assembly protein FimV